MNRYADKNMPIVEKLVNREVISCMSSAVDLIQKYDPDSFWDTLENFQADSDGNFPDVMEWWMVTPWIQDKLRDKGEVVGSNELGCLWGRCCSGQAIYLDSVWYDIAHDMGILKGQKYSWDTTWSAKALGALSRITVWNHELPKSLRRTDCFIYTVPHDLVPYLKRGGCSVVHVRREYPVYLAYIKKENAQIQIKKETQK